MCTVYTILLIVRVTRVIKPDTNVISHVFKRVVKPVVNVINLKSYNLKGACLWRLSSGQVKCYYVQHLVLIHVRLFGRLGDSLFRHVPIYMYPYMYPCMYPYIVRHPTRVYGFG